jgi:hypothetical protein
MVDYSRDLRAAEWGSGVSLHGSNPEPLMSALEQVRVSCPLYPQKRTLRAAAIVLAAIARIGEFSPAVDAD